MNDDSKPAERVRQEPCPVCLKLITEYRHAGLKIPSHIFCAFGHRLADYPKIHSAPERFPVWVWTAPLTKGA